LIRDNVHIEVREFSFFSYFFSQNIVQKSIQSEIDKRVDQLAELLTSDLQNPSIKSSESRKIIGYLLRLGFGDKVTPWAQVILINIGERNLSRHA
jgi:hypothetical protein